MLAPTAITAESLFRPRMTIDADGTVYERLQRSLDIYLDWVRRRPTRLKLLMTAERHPEQGAPQFDFDALRQEHIDEMTELFQRGVDRGELRPDLDYEEAVLALFGMIDHRMILFLHGRPFPEDLPTRLLDLFFNGVRA